MLSAYVQHLSLVPHFLGTWGCCSADRASGGGIKHLIQLFQFGAPQTFVLHPKTALKGACLCGSSLPVAVCPRGLLQLFTVNACTATCSLDSGPHSCSVSVMERPCLASPLFHVLLVMLSLGQASQLRCFMGSLGIPQCRGHLTHSWKV